MRGAFKASIKQKKIIFGPKTYFKKVFPSYAKKKLNEFENF